MNALKSYFFVLCTVGLTVYSQLAIKWGMQKAAPVLPTLEERDISFLLAQLFNPWILSSLVSAFLALITWMMALTRLELSHAYPFMSLAFVLVLFLSHAFFNEPLTAPKVIGVVFIMIGMAIGSQG